MTGKTIKGTIYLAYDRPDGTAVFSHHRGEDVLPVGEDFIVVGGYSTVTNGYLNDVLVRRSAIEAGRIKVSRGDASTPGVVTILGITV